MIASLKDNADFRRLYYRGKSAANGYLAVYCRRNRLGRNRLGLTVSTKLGHAVVRNRVRRRLREIVRLNEARLAVGYDIVIVARRAAPEADFAALTQAFVTLADKLGLSEERK